MGTLLKADASVINYFTGSNGPIFRSAAADFSKFGTGSSNQYTTTPDGATTAYEVLSGENQSVTVDVNIKSVARTGRTALMVFNAGYAGTSSATTTAYMSPSMSLRFDNDGGFTAPWWSRSVNLHLGWNCIVTGREIGTAITGHPIGSEGTTGTSAWATDTHTRFRTVISGVGAGLTTRIYYAQLVDNIQAESRLVLRFDDAYASVYTVAFPIMQAFGLVGVLGVISSRIGTVGYMTWEQVAELHAAGWEIANHTKTHSQVDYAESEAYWLTEIGDCSDEIEANVGVRPTTFVSPYGNMARGTATGYRSAVQLLFDVSMGTTDANLGPLLLTGHHLPCHNVRTHSGGVNAAGHLTRIRGVVAAGCSSILMYHNILTGPTTDDVDLLTADFTAQMALIFQLKEAGFCKVPTMKQFADEVGIGFQLLPVAA
ncbi:MAG: polysaccharide deacetylase family protein [Chthonomonas sp.]|nr:polysaccharide deacetylase family protein [Chthonomonas sp.]